MSGTLRLNKIKFYVGSKPGAAPLEIESGTITVLVGPNNSGKSLALFEIGDLCTGSYDDPQRLNTKVIESIEIDLPTDLDTGLKLAQESARYFSPTTNSVSATPPVIFTSPRSDEHPLSVQYGQVSQKEFKDAIDTGNKRSIRMWLMPSYVIRLDGRTRFELVNPQPRDDLKQPPTNHLSILLRDHIARKRIRELTTDAFGLYFVIDPTEAQQFVIRMSFQDPGDLNQELSITDEARNYYGEAQHIGQTGDGVQSFVGLFSAMLSHQYRVILIDEPEAFLSQPLQRRVGNHLVQIANEQVATLIVSTHSADFLLGCLETDIERMSLVRLTYQSKAATARTLPASDLKILVRDPLVRSTGVLSALFITPP